MFWIGLVDFFDARIVSFWLELSFYICIYRIRDKDS